MKKLHVLAFGMFILGCQFITGQQAVNNKLLNDFQSDDWQLVQEAKDDIENQESRYLEDVINLFESKETKKLQNTGDLIYPGAKKFFGHGQIIDYDIDRISIRAGWLLEDLTFQNFGFSGIHIHEDELIGYIKITFPNFYNNSANRKLLSDCTTQKKRDLMLELCIEKVKNWFSIYGQNWKRFNALSEALKSYDEKRQVKALFYLRNGTTSCTGLTKDSYKAYLEELIRKLSRVGIKRVSENAKLILMDDDYDWLSIKAN